MKATKAKPFSEMNIDERAAHFAASPFMKKKNADMIAFLEKHPIPKRILNK
jgi:hypothetical protein